MGGIRKYILHKLFLPVGKTSAGGKASGKVGEVCITWRDCSIGGRGIV